MNRGHWEIGLVAAVLTASAVDPCWAQGDRVEDGALEARSWSPDEPELGSVEAIRRFTTSPEFLPPSVEYLPESPTVPDDFGMRIEAEGGEEYAGERPPAEPAPAMEDEGEDDKKLPLLLSGFVKGADEIEGQPAILDVPAGKGRVILFSFNPLHRYLNHSDFRFAYNAILHWNDLPEP